MYRRRVRDAEGVERGAEWGGSIPLPSRLGGLGQRRKLPQRGPGPSPGRKRSLVHFELEKTNAVMTNFSFVWRISRVKFTRLALIFFSHSLGGLYRPLRPLLWLRQWIVLLLLTAFDIACLLAVVRRKQRRRCTSYIGNSIASFKQFLLGYCRSRSEERRARGGLLEELGEAAPPHQLWGLGALWGSSGVQGGTPETSDLDRTFGPQKSRKQHNRDTHSFVKCVFSHCTGWHKWATAGHSGHPVTMLKEA